MCLTSCVRKCLYNLLFLYVTVCVWLRLCIPVFLDPFVPVPSKIPWTRFSPLPHLRFSPLSTLLGLCACIPREWLFPGHQCPLSPKLVVSSLSSSYPPSHQPGTPLTTPSSGNSPQPKFSPPLTGCSVVSLGAFKGQRAQSSGLWSRLFYFISKF